MNVQDLSHLANQGESQISEDQLRITSLEYATRITGSGGVSEQPQQFIARATAIYGFLKNGPNKEVDTGAQQH